MARRSNQPNRGVLAAFRNREAAAAYPKTHPLFQRRVLFEPETVIPGLVARFGADYVAEELRQDRLRSPIKPGCPLGQLKRRAINEWLEGQTASLAQTIHN